MSVMSESTPDARTRLGLAAVQAFGDRGFHGTTTRDISTAAGMSPAALYVHHRSKEELLFELAEVGHLRVLDLVTAAAATSDDPVEQLGRVAEEFSRDHALSHTGARVINYELAHLTPEHLAEIRGIRHRIDLVVRDVLWGKVSREGARSDYGVVVLGPQDDPSADLDATEALRADLRSRRTGDEPFFDRGPGYARLSSGASSADCDHL